MWPNQSIKSSRSYVRDGKFPIVRFQMWLLCVCQMSSPLLSRLCQHITLCITLSLHALQGSQTHSKMKLGHKHLMLHFLSLFLNLNFQIFRHECNNCPKQDTVANMTNTHSNKYWMIGKLTSKQPEVTETV